MNLPYHRSNLLNVDMHEGLLALEFFIYQFSRFAEVSVDSLKKVRHKKSTTGMPKLGY